MFTNVRPSSSPLISCLCVTRNKISLLKRAITCFKAQTHKNKELVIVYEDNDLATRKYVKTLRGKNLKIVEVPTVPKRTLGELRNISIQNAKGEYFCQWDADDWYHSKRLEIQLACITTMCKPVCILTYWILFDDTTKKAYLSVKRMWEGSILCRKSVATATALEYPSLSKEEDLHFVRELLKQHIVYPADIPQLYIYVYHQANTWDYEHFRINFNAGKELSRGASTVIRNILAGRYSHRKASKLLSEEKMLSEMSYKYEM